MKDKLTDADRAAIVALALQGGVTGAEIARRYDVSAAAICKLLKKRGIKLPAKSPLTQKRVECPFSAERLREMYWKQAMSLAEIAEFAAPLLAKQPSQRLVTRWLGDAQITLRTFAEAQKINALKYPAQHLKAAIAMRNAPHPRAGRFTAAAQRKGRRAIAKMRRGHKTAPKSLPVSAEAVAEAGSDFNLDAAKAAQPELYDWLVAQGRLPSQNQEEN